MTQAETALLSWMIEFYKKCEQLENELSTPDHKQVQEYKNKYKELKLDIREKYRQVSKIKVGKDFKDNGFLNRCVSNIGESAAWGFTERVSSNNIHSLFLSVEEGSYKISKFMSEYSDKFTAIK